MKKILFTFACILFASISVWAQSTFVADGITYHVLSEADDNATFGTVSVVAREDGFYEGDISIPNAVKNSKDQYADTYKVVAIDKGAFKDCSHLKKVSISASIENIGDNAFENCVNLDNVNFATGNLKSIGNNVFQNSGLKQITIPEGITELGSRLFYECTKLSEVDLPSTLNSIGEDVFYHCIALKAIELPSRLQKMGACFQQSGIESIKLPVKIIGVPDYCFSGCKSLVTVELSTYTNRLGHSAFSGCSSLTSISLPQDIKTINAQCFAGCEALKAISLPSSVNIIDYGAFQGCTSLASMSLPNSVDSLGGYTFAGCTNLTAVTLSSMIKKIPNQCFSGCTSLVSIILPQSIECVEYEAFSKCTSLTEVDFPRNIRQVDNYAFDGCTALVKIAGLPETATVGELAFDKCKKILDKVYDNLSIKSKSFNGLTITKIEFNDNDFFVYVTCKVDVKNTDNRIYEVTSTPMLQHTPLYTIQFPKKLTIHYKDNSKEMSLCGVEKDVNKRIDAFDLDIRTFDQEPFDTHFILTCKYLPINIHNISIYNEDGKAIFDNVKF